MRVSLFPALVMLCAGLAGCGEPDPATPAAPTVPPPSLSDLPSPWNQADLANGASLFIKCATCHTVGRGQNNKVGPNLHGVFDREPASAPKFPYSPALKAFDVERWTPELIDQWLAKPKAFLPGNGMFFDGLAQEEDRRDLIAWLLIETRR